MTQNSPTVINDIADLYRILDEQPQWKEAIRNLVLGAELLALPQRLDQLTEQIHELRETVSQLAQTAAENTRQLVELRQVTAENTRQLVELRQVTEEHTRQLTELTTQVKELRATAEEHTRQLVELRQVTEEHTRQLTELTTQVKELRETAAENTRQLADLRRISDNHTARMDRMETDSGEIKGMLAEADPDRISEVIAAALDLFRPTLVPRSELAELSRQLNLERSTRVSFVNADLVFTAHNHRDTPIYCAVEISWTIAQRDLDRVHRNATLLQQATGAPAYAVATGQRYEDNLDWREVLWVQLRDR